VCDRAAGKCAVARDLAVDLAPACTQSGQCGNLSQPVCGADGSCRACRDSGDDAACAAHGLGRCGASGACVACRAATQAVDCTSPIAPVCGSDGSCRGCRAHGECDSLVCSGDGSCAVKANVVYVNNGVVCSAMPAGTQGDPYCDIQAAVAGRGTRTLVRVLGSATPYGPVSLTDTSISLIGPGANPAAIINGLTQHGIAIQGTGTVLIDGFEITASAGAHDGIRCATTGTMQLEVLRSYIHENNRFGINVGGCDLAIDRTMVTSNGGGGISVSNSGFDIENCIVAKNGTIGVSFGPPLKAGSIFNFNTVVQNGTPGTVGGVLCGVSLSIENSIVWGNSKGGNSQLSGSCNLSVVDIDEAGGTFNVQPDFTADFHLNGRTANNLACCIDQIASSPVDHDFDGTHRPINVKWDVGAHEVN
jgi:hypothetical protein